MQIDRDTVVALKYVLYDADGNVIEKTDDAIEYLHGGYQNIFARVERALEGKSVGESCKVKLTPEDAFGDYDAELVHVEPRDKFPPDLTVGMQFRGDASESGETLVYTVTDIAEDKVVVDGNHPLAGQTLNFECTVTDVRAATDEETQHGHVHGAHGHHH
jgi:FKBP-type peptidyl-prolyl cis-trans isomerase SlyD